MIEIRIRVTVKVNKGIFKPSVTSEEFSFCAESREVALHLASKNVKTRGLPFDEKHMEVLSASLPIRHESKRTMGFREAA